MSHLRRLAEPIADPARMTFKIDWDTARVIKAKAKESRYYLPDYIAQLVRRGLAAERKAK